MSLALVDPSQAMDGRVGQRKIKHLRIPFKIDIEKVWAKFCRYVKCILKHSCGTPLALDLPQVLDR